MPSAADKMVSIESLTAQLSLTSPCPNPKTHADLVSVHDLHREEDLLRNPSSFRAWWTAITNTREALNAQQKLEREEPSSGPSSEVAGLLGPLATPLTRLSLQRLTFIYEAALVQFPGSFKLWKSYLQMRMSYVLGKPVLKKKAGGKKKFPEMKDALEEERGDLEQWEGGLDGVVGWEEWKSLVAVFERALMWLPKVRLIDTFNIHCYIPTDPWAAATPIMADVPLHIFPLPLSTPPHTHARTPHLRPRPPHALPFPPLPYLGPLSPLRRVPRWPNNRLSLPSLPCG